MNRKNRKGGGATAPTLKPPLPTAGGKGSKKASKAFPGSGKL